jgi:hypothetical protein
VTREIRIKRFRCKDCCKTFGWLPWFVLRYIRPAAVLVQRCWERWTEDRASLEDIAWGEGVAARSLQRWLAAVWKRRQELNLTVRRLVRGVEFSAPPKDSRNHRPWSLYLLILIRLYLQHTVRPRVERSRVPYHYSYALK